MRFVGDEERAALAAWCELAEGNPFRPERVSAERTVLGPDFVEHGRVWHVDAALDGANPNVPRLAERAGALAAELRARLAAGARAEGEDLRGYRALVYYLLFTRLEEDFVSLALAEPGSGASTEPVRAWDAYRRDFDHLLRVRGVRASPPHAPEHVFALGYQIRRAFHHLYRGIYGASRPAARLRADVWESIFTRDAARYRRGLHERMADIPTLVVGESGTGKELVARAIGLSGYVPFDPRGRRFRTDPAGLFHPVNLAALPSSLIESELFGHRRGAFTGAVEDRAGWLESCPVRGTIFLDEIGELEPVLQVKLLRVLQERVFTRVGDTRERGFEGRIVAATNRDLAAEMQAGRFRPDLYYRLCADVVRTPTLGEQIADAPEALHNLVLVLARRVAGPGEGDALARDATAWIASHLGVDYPWPGNVRELEQCLRSFLVRGAYAPAARADDAEDRFLDAVRRGELTADEILRAYTARVWRQAGSYEAAARRLGVDRRTVKARVAAPGRRAD